MVDLTVAKLLPNGSRAQQLKTAQERHSRVDRELVALDGAITEAYADSRRAVAGGVRSIDATMQDIGRLNLRETAARHEARDLDQLIAFLEDPETAAAFDAAHARREREQSQRFERRVAALDSAERHLHEAAKALLIVGLDEPLLAGALQRFQAFCGASVAGVSAISPAVSHRGNETLCEIFLRVKRPDPPVAA